MLPNPQETVDFVTFTEEILDGKLNFLRGENKLPLQESIFYRLSECSILKKTSVCIGCCQKQKKLLQRNNKSIKRKTNSLTIPFKPKAPISLTSHDRIKVTIQFIEIMSNVDKSEVSSFMKFFRVEQQKHFNVSCRNRLQRCSIKIDVLKNFAKFTGRHLCQILFFNKIAGLRPSI